MNQITRAETGSLGVFDDEELQQIERLTMLAHMASGHLPKAAIQEILHQAVAQEFTSQIKFMARSLADAITRLKTTQ